MTSELWTHLDPVTLQLMCDGKRHRITLGPAGVEVHDHDADAELVLDAFGTQAPRCVSIAKLWRMTLGAEHLPVIAGDDRISTWAIRRGTRRRVRAHRSGELLDVTDAALAFRTADPPKAIRSLLGARVLLDTTIGRPSPAIAELIAGTAPGTDVHAVCRRGYLFPTLAFGWSDGTRTVAAVALGRGWDSAVRRPRMSVVDDHFILHAGQLPGQQDVTFVFALRWEKSGPGWFAVPRRGRVVDGEVHWGTVGTIRPRL